MRGCRTGGAGVKMAVGSALLAVVLGGAGLLGLVYALQRSLIYFPEVTPPPAAVAMAVPGLRDVRVTTEDGLDLRGWWLPVDSATPAAAVVLFHGNAGHFGHRLEKARVLREAGYAVLLVGYRGYGGNPGRPNEAGLYADARAFLTWVRQQGVNPLRTLLYGESLGSGVAVRMAAERRVGAVVLEAPFTRLADVGAHHYPWLPVRLLLHDRFDNLASIGAVEEPILVIHGEADAVVPVAQGRALVAAARSGTGVFLPGVAHNTVFWSGGRQAVLPFLARYMPR